MSPVVSPNLPSNTDGTSPAHAIKECETQALRIKLVKSHRRGKGRCAIRHQMLRLYTTLGDSA